MSWDPHAYLSFADVRTRPAAELLTRIPVQSPARVADLGCGPGNSTALLAARWPNAEIEGIDSAPQMIAAAAATELKVQWTIADIATWSPPNLLDVIFSNAALQWLGDHKALLPRLIGFLKPGGIFAFQMPRNYDAPSHRLMAVAAAAGPWADKLSVIPARTIAPPEFYFDILALMASELDIWETSYLHCLEGDDPVFRWTRATGLRPYEQALEGAEREGFLEIYRALLREAYPRRDDGKTLFPFQRLFVVARA